MPLFIPPPTRPFVPPTRTSPGSSDSWSPACIRDGFTSARFRQSATDLCAKWNTRTFTNRVNTGCRARAERDALGNGRLPRTVSFLHDGPRGHGDDARIGESLGLSFIR